MIHGTLGAYTHGRCRCQACRDRWNEYQRERWHRTRAGRPDLRKQRKRTYEHGTLYCYRSGRCRCDECRAENARYGRELYARRQQRAILRRRLPFEPLERLLQLPSTVALARFAGVHAREVYRWQARGIPAYRADVLATRAGIHPAEVWPDAWLSVRGGAGAR